MYNAGRSGTQNENPCLQESLQRTHVFMPVRANSGVSGMAITCFLLFAVCASAQTMYRDPGGNFTVDVPAGSHAEKHQESSEVTISKGNVSVSLEVAPSADGSTPPPREVLDSIEKQLLQECPEAELLRRGDATLAGQPGLYLQVACNDPQHGTAIMTVAVATTNAEILICNTSSFSSEYSSIKPVLDGIVRSFRLGNGSAGMPSAGNSNQTTRRQGNAASGPEAKKLRALEDACSWEFFLPMNAQQSGLR